jgi:putative membrane protein
VLALPAAAVHADKKTDTTETAAGKRTTNLAGASDRKFVEKAASGGMAEVQLGHLAMEKGTSPTVKEFGKRMVDDHGKANDELKEIASKKNFALPTDVDSETKATYDKLTKLSGTDFDKAYIDAMVKDHDADVKEFKKEASTGGVDPDLKAWAEKTLNVIEQHDHIAHQDKDAIKK